MPDERLGDESPRRQYHYRRPAGMREVLSAAVVAAGAAAVAFYAALLFVQRTPLLPEVESSSRSAGVRRGR